MKKGWMFLADGFEATEAIATCDVLLRTHQIEMSLIAVGESLEVIASNGLVVRAHALWKEKQGQEDYDFIVLPGGKKGVENLKKDSALLVFIKNAYEQGNGVYAICAAPSILGELGLLRGKNYTCFPGFESKEGRYLENEGVVRDGHLITARSMAWSIPFGEAIAKDEVGEKPLEEAKPGMYGIRVAGVSRRG